MVRWPSLARRRSARAMILDMMSFGQGPMLSVQEGTMNYLRIAEIRIENFRLLRDLWMPLADLTVLIGANNSGKTALLQALGVALGEQRAGVDDLHLDVQGNRSECFVVDLLVHPGIGEEFTESVRDLFADAIQLPLDGAEFVAIRTYCAPDIRRGGIWPRRSFLKGWARTAKDAANLSEIKRPVVTREVLDLFSYNFLDARRDIVDQLQGRATYWGKLAGSLDIDEHLRGEIEVALNDLSEKIVKGSAVLEQVRSEIDLITEALTPGSPGVNIEPLPAKVEDLARGMDVSLQAPGSAAIPMSRQGMGTRSLAALTVFSAFVKIRTASGPTALTVLALEEPEAHLHPQAQRAVFELASTIQGQRILSTHSPYVTGVADVFDFRVFRRLGPVTQVCWVDRNTRAGARTFTPDELEKIRRFVQLRHGEVLFARMVILVEGETEEAAMPVFARNYWRLKNIHDRGISLVNAEGAQNYKHYVVLLARLGIPWIILADGDTEGQKGVAAVGVAIGRPLQLTSPEVVMLPTESDGFAFEAYLLSEGFESQIQKAIETVFGDSALEEYRIQHQGMKKKGGGTRDYHSDGWKQRLIYDFMMGNKARLGAAVAEEISREVDSSGPPKLPVKVLELFNRIDVLLDGV
jgi:putative ATP-dependent endonuclease of the OLD family